MESMLPKRMRYCLHAGIHPHTTPPLLRPRALFGVGKSFAKFREKFARGAAGAEIFRNLPLMFGDQQWATLGDYIQSALMLSYNGRAVG